LSIPAVVSSTAEEMRCHSKTVSLPEEICQMDMNSLLAECDQ